MQHRYTAGGDKPYMLGFGESESCVEGDPVQTAMEGNIYNNVHNKR